MKTIVLVALLFTSTFASSLFREQFHGARIGGEKRDVVNADAMTCSSYSYQCVATGGQCSNGCPDCQATAKTCATNAGLNATALCECLSTLVNCFAAAKDASCDSNAAQQACMAYTTNCTCGTVYTGATSLKTCSSNAYCNDQGTCSLVKAVGQPCNRSAECGDSNANPIYTNDYMCVKNKCIQSYKALPGDSCSVDSDCEFNSGYSLGCSNGKCKSQAVGSECPSSDYVGNSYCGPNLYCDDSNTCQKSIAIGSSCNGNSTSVYQCGFLGNCDTTSNMCVKFLSKSKGQSCSFDGECMSGLYCSMNTSTCQTDLTPISCNSDADCTKANPDYEGCYCDGNGKSMCVPPTTDTGCDDETLAVYQCASDNNCFPEDLTPGGCMQKNCQKQVDCYVACQVNYSKNSEGDGSVCFSNYSNTCDSPSAASENVVAWAVVAIASVAAILL